MQNVLGTGLALGIILGGFALTGDLGRLVSRGMRVIQSTDVPDNEAPIPVATAPAPQPAAPGLPAVAAAVRPLRRGLDAVDVSMLAVGSRMLVWIGHPAPSTAGEVRCLALDLVDPASREALVTEMPPPAAGQPAVAPAPPRRVLIAGSGPAGTITRGGMLTLQSRGIVGDGDRESLGPIVAVDVTR